MMITGEYAPPFPVKHQKPRYAGSHPCMGGCGKLVSGNKQRCIDCLVRWAAQDMRSRGLDAEEDDLKRLMLLA